MDHNRLSSIDSLRGVAIIGVVAVHAVLSTANVHPIVSSLAAYGARGVQLFFILSAITLFTVYSGKTLQPGEFYRRRFFRIAPMFYCGALAYTLMNGLGVQPFAPEGIGARQILLTTTFLHGFDITSFNAVVPGGWSIACEATFYLLFPLFLRYITCLKQALVAIAASFVLAVAWMVMVRRFYAGSYSDEVVQAFVSFGFLFNLPSFLGGVAVYMAVTDRRFASFFTRPVAYGCLGLSLAVLAVLAVANLRSPLYAAAPISLAVLSVMALKGSRFHIPLLERIGVVSFSIYIVHFAVIHFIELNFKPFMTGTLMSLAVMAATLAISFFISIFTYRYVEVPFINLGKSLGMRTTQVAK